MSSWSIGGAKKKRTVNKTVVKGVAAKSIPDNDPPQIKFDVFVSFRGDDIRNNFLGHMIMAFHRKQIHAFVDENLKRGDDIWDAFVEAIKGSFISVIIFSKDYASSHWCLDELVEIIKCKEKYGRIVIPVFLGVDPSHVRNQKESYGDAFVEHEKKYDFPRVQSWKLALNKAGKLSGVTSEDFPNEVKLLEEIINNVSMMLGSYPINTEGLVGINKPIAYLDTLLHQETEKVFVIGIWGMSGIGKTTIAEEIFSKNCSEYEGCCFIEKVSEKLRTSNIRSLKETVFSKLLGEEVKIDTPNGLLSNIKRRIGRMKVLIVLDDVKEVDQLKMLFETPDWFRCDSRIIVTTTNKHVLIANDVDDIYEVGVLDSFDALELFNLNAFKQNQLQSEYYELSKRVVSYAKGLPIVLKNLGRLLRGKGKEFWESQLDELKKMPNKEAQDVMKLSYVDLDRVEKKIFLDIACFFNGMNVNTLYMKVLLKDSGSDNSVFAVLERLKYKALLTNSADSIVSMHDVLQEMGREIVRQESIQDPGRRSRLWDPDDVCEVLNNDKGTEAIRSIIVDSLAIRKLKLSPHVFAKMTKLQFLYFHGEYNDDCSGLFPQGLQYWPPSLRFVHWMNFPLKSLPEEFSAENLVYLDLLFSRLETLWYGVKNLVNLREVTLKGSKTLKELPDFSKAVNLESLDLSYCSELNHVHPSIFSLNKLLMLNLSFCNSLTNITRNIHLCSLRYLNLTECNNLGDISVNASFDYQSKLEFLVLIGNLFESLPSWIKNQTRLIVLDLRFCSNLRALPELPSSLEILLVKGCESLKIVLFPSIIEQFKRNMKMVGFWNCLNLDEHSLKNIALNAQINLMKYAYQHLPKTEHGCVENYEDYGDNYTYFQAMHVYPESSIPKWLEYKTTKEDMIIDLSVPQPNPLGFIFCFILSTGVVEWGAQTELYVTIIDDEGVGKKIPIKIHVDTSSIILKTNHVCIIYDDLCSSLISRRVTHKTRLKIKATIGEGIDIFEDQPVVKLKGFGVSTINSSTYINFIQQMGLFHYISKLNCIVLSILLYISLQKLRMKDLI